jgi:hypothetical protein
MSERLGHPLYSLAINRSAIEVYDTGQATHSIRSLSRWRLGKAVGWLDDRRTHRDANEDSRSDENAYFFVSSSCDGCSLERVR